MSQDTPLRRKLGTGALLLFLAALFLRLTPPVADPDFWWHLATGRWIVEHRRLPSEDPFGPPAEPGAPPFLRQVPLRQYWLSQVLLHGVHTAFGLHGVILLRALVMLGTFWLLVRLLRLGRAPLPLALLLVFLAAWASVGELGIITDRPQLWTAFLSPLLLLLLEASLAGRRRAAFLIPPLMLLWGNLHGGVLLGLGIMGLHAAGAVTARQAGRRYLLSTLAGAGFAFCNPVGLVLPAFVLHGLGDAATRAQWGTVVEAQSLLRHSGLGGILTRLPVLAALSLLSLAAVPVILIRTPRRIPLVAVHLGALGLALAGIRFLPFLTLTAAAVIAAALVAVGTRLRLLPWRSPPWGAWLVALPASLVLVAGGWPSTGLRSAEPYDASCRRAADFVSAQGLGGTLFNDLRDGGYLIWRLAPAVRVLVDGRLLSPHLFGLYRQAMEDPFAPPSPPESGLAYQRILAETGADLVLIPACDPALGTILPLGYALLVDHRWALLHADGSRVVFARLTGEHAARLAASALPRAAFWRVVLAAARLSSRTTHGSRSHGWKLSLAIAHRELGERDEARRWLADYRQALPDDPTGRRLEETLR